MAWLLHLPECIFPPLPQRRFEIARPLAQARRIVSNHSPIRPPGMRSDVRGNAPGRRRHIIVQEEEQVPAGQSGALIARHTGTLACLFVAQQSVGRINSIERGHGIVLATICYDDDLHEPRWIGLLSQRAKHRSKSRLLSCVGMITLTVTSSVTEDPLYERGNYQKARVMMVHVFDVTSLHSEPCHAVSMIYASGRIQCLGVFRFLGSSGKTSFPRRNPGNRVVAGN